MLKRADVIMDLVDALTVTGRVDSSTSFSEETPFRRKFSSIFNTLRLGEIDFDLLLSALHEYQPANSEELVGCEAYGLDSTPNEREEAETLEDRVSLKAQKEDPVRLRSNLEFYKRPKSNLKGAKGTPVKHVAKFKLSEPSKAPDRAETFFLGEQTVKLEAWQGLHFK